VIVEGSAKLVSKRAGANSADFGTNHLTTLRALTRTRLSTVASRRTGTEAIDAANLPTR